MNENIDLTKILKDCPKGFKLYTPLYGEVVFEDLSGSGVYTIVTNNSNNRPVSFSKEGFYYYYAGAECLLFPSKEQRDWDKFNAPWLKKEKFDVNTLNQFDRVLVRNSCCECWICALYSHKRNEEDSIYRYATTNGSYQYCIPYNDDTKHLVGTEDEPSDYYRYWED